MGTLNTGDWLSIANIVVFISGTYAGWHLRRNATNKAMQKEHCTREITKIQQEYSATLNELFSNKFRPQVALIWFRLMNIQVRNVMMYLHKDFGIHTDKLSPYQVELRELVTNSPEFITQYAGLGAMKTSEQLRNELLLFQSQHSHLFNEIIRDIHRH